MSHGRARLCAVACVIFMMLVGQQGIVSNQGDDTPPSAAESRAVSPMLPTQSVNPLLPSSQTLVNGTQTQGDCGSGWTDLNASDDMRCGYREANVGSSPSSAYLLPNANGDTTSWKVKGGTGCNSESAEWDCLDDYPNNDGDGTYIKSTAKTVTDSIENLGTVNLNGGTVTSVALTIWCRRTVAQAVAVRGVIKTHGLVYLTDADYNCPTPSYGTTGKTWTANPNTGAAWTQAEIDALQAGCRDKDGSTREVRCTLVRVEVMYVAPPRYALEVRFAWSNVSTLGKTSTLIVECQRLHESGPAGENVLVQVGQGGNPPSSWWTAYTCTSNGDVSFNSYNLTSTEMNGGAPVARVWDNQGGTPDTAQESMYLDVLRIELDDEAYQTSGETYDTNVTAPSKPVQSFEGLTFSNPYLSVTIGNDSTQISGAGGWNRLVDETYWAVEVDLGGHWQQLDREAVPTLRTWSGTKSHTVERHEQLWDGSVHVLDLVTRFTAPILGEGSDPLKLEVEIIPGQNVTAKLLWKLEGVNATTLSRAVVNQTDLVPVGGNISLAGSGWYAAAGENYLQLFSYDSSVLVPLYIGDVTPSYAGVGVDAFSGESLMQESESWTNVSLEFGPVQLRVDYVTWENMSANDTAIQVTEVLDPYIGAGPYNFGFYEDFSDGDMQGWTGSSGSWALNSGSSFSWWVHQSQTSNSNTNLYIHDSSGLQTGSTTYSWRQRIESEWAGAGMHIRSTDGSVPGRGNSYLVWFTPWLTITEGGLYLYETISGQLTVRARNPSLVAKQMTWQTLDVLVDTGLKAVRISVDGRHALEWSYAGTSPPAGEYLSLRTHKTAADFDNIRFENLANRVACRFDQGECGAQRDDADPRSGFDYWGRTTRRSRPGGDRWSEWVAEVGTQGTTSETLIWRDDIDLLDFPRTTWTVGDDDPGNGRDYWDDRATWHCDGGRVHSGGWAVWVADREEDCRSTYDHFQRSYMWRTIPATPTATGRLLRYWYWSSTEQGYDFWQVIYWDNTRCPLRNGYWCYVDLRTGHDGQWRLGETSIPLTAQYVGFYFFSDYSVQAEGVYLDDIELVSYTVSQVPNANLQRYDNDMMARWRWTSSAADGRTSQYSTMVLSFWAWVKTSDTDYFSVYYYYIHTDGTVFWKFLATISGDSSTWLGNVNGWVVLSYPIPAVHSGVEFYFISGSTGTAEGVYIDDVTETAYGAIGPALEESVQERQMMTIQVIAVELTVHGTGPYLTAGGYYPIQKNEWVAIRYTILNSGPTVVFEELLIHGLNNSGSPFEFGHTSATIPAGSFFSWTGYAFLDQPGTWTFSLRYKSDVWGPVAFMQSHVAVRFQDTDDPPNPPPSPGPIDFLTFGYYSQLTLVWSTRWNYFGVGKGQTRSVSFALQTLTNVLRVDLAMNDESLTDLWVIDSSGNTIIGRPTPPYDSSHPGDTDPHNRFVDLAVRAGQTYTLYMYVRETCGALCSFQFFVREFDLLNTNAELVVGMLPQIEYPTFTYFPIVYVNTDRVHRGASHFAVNVFLEVPAAQGESLWFNELDIEMWLKQEGGLPEGQRTGWITSVVPQDANLHVEKFGCPTAEPEAGFDLWPGIPVSFSVGVSIPIDDEETGYSENPDHTYSRYWWRSGCTKYYTLDAGDTVGMYYEVDWNLDGVHLIGVQLTLRWSTLDILDSGTIYHIPHTTSYQLLIPIRADESN